MGFSVSFRKSPLTWVDCDSTVARLIFGNKKTTAIEFRDGNTVAAPGAARRENDIMIKVKRKDPGKEKGVESLLTVMTKIYIYIYI